MFTITGADEMAPIISPQRVKSSLSTIEWSPDGAQVTKRHEPIANADKLGPRTVILGHHHAAPGQWARHFAYELRVNQLLTRHRPPVELTYVRAGQSHETTVTLGSQSS